MSGVLKKGGNLNSKTDMHTGKMSCEHEERDPETLSGNHHKL